MKRISSSILRRDQKVKPSKTISLKTLKNHRISTEKKLLIRILQIIRSQNLPLLSLLTQQNKENKVITAFLEIECFSRE